MLRYCRLIVWLAETHLTTCTDSSRPRQDTGQALGVDPIYSYLSLLAMTNSESHCDKQIFSAIIFHPLNKNCIQSFHDGPFLELNNRTQRHMTHIFHIFFFGSSCIVSNLQIYRFPPPHPKHYTLTYLFIQTFHKVFMMVLSSKLNY